MKEDHPERKSRELVELEEMLRSRGLPVTLQRRVVLEVLIGRTDHPSAERIYEDIKASYPEVARATVYRTLEKLVEIGALRKVCHPGSSIRYDPRTGRHHHLVCLHCNKMIDFCDLELDEIPLPAARSTGFRISDYSIQFRGICDDCRKKRSRQPPATRRRKQRG